MRRLTLGGDRARGRAWLSIGLGLLLMVLGAGVYLLFGWGAPDRAKPLDLTPAAVGRWVESAPFRAVVGGHYRASLVLDRTHSLGELECLADVGSPFPASSASGRRTDCRPAFTPTQLDWSVLEDGRPLAPSYRFGPHAGEYGSGLGRSLATFDLQPGRIYVVRARITGASPRLWAANPRLELAFDQTASLSMRALFGSLSSIGMGLFGLWLLIAGVRAGVRPPLIDGGAA